MEYFAKKYICQLKTDVWQGSEYVSILYISAFKHRANPDIVSAVQTFLIKIFA